MVEVEVEVGRDWALGLGAHRVVALGLVLALVGCRDEPPVPALVPGAGIGGPEGAGDSQGALTEAELRALVQERSQAGLPGADDTGPEVPAASEVNPDEDQVDWYDAANGSPFSLLEKGSLDDLLPTEENFVRVLWGSDQVEAEDASALWAAGDARRAYEICMHLAAAAAFARGYQDREVDRFLAGKTSIPLAKELGSAGAYLRTHVRDRVGLERALDQAHEHSRLHLWLPRGLQESEDELDDWCLDFYEVLSHTTTLVYEEGIEPYLEQ